MSESTKRGGVRPNSGRPPIMSDRVTLTIYVDRRLKSALEAAASERHVTISDLCRSTLARDVGWEPGS